MQADEEPREEVGPAGGVEVGVEQQAGAVERQVHQDHGAVEVLLAADRQGRVQHQQDQGGDGGAHRHRQAEEGQLREDRHHQVCCLHSFCRK